VVEIGRSPVAPLDLGAHATDRAIAKLDALQFAGDRDAGSEGERRL
jgi:hypothetical protein